jgi:hypothetical protein
MNDEFLTLGQRLVMAARLAAARHGETQHNEEQGMPQQPEVIGGADRALVTDDPQE